MSTGSTPGAPAGHNPQRRIPYCPYRIAAARARRLVAASGSRGATLTVWASPEPSLVPVEARYVASVLRRLGYRVRVRGLGGGSASAGAHVITGGWTADYPTVGNFISRLPCG